jgi:hypothetical protein
VSGRELGLGALVGGGNAVTLTAPDHSRDDHSYSDCANRDSRNPSEPEVSLRSSAARYLSHVVAVVVRPLPQGEEPPNDHGSNSHPTDPSASWLRQQHDADNRKAHKGSEIDDRTHNKKLPAPEGTVSWT